MSIPAEPEPNAQREQRALVLDNDLFFSTKITETLRHLGFATRTARRGEDFARELAEERPTLVLVNASARGLDWRAAITAAKAADVPVVAFAAHVDTATHDAARQAGATRVISNSKLNSDLPGVVARALRQRESLASPAEATPQATTSSNDTQTRTDASTA